MTALAPISATAPQPSEATPKPVAQPFGLRIVVGMLGVLIASLSAGLNEKVTDLAMTDVRGALSIGHDEGTWLIALYSAAQVAAMAFAPWFSVTVSLRRFTLGAIAVFALLALLCPFAPKDAPINLSCSRGKLQFSRHLQRHWTKSDRKIMYGELFRPVLRVKREPHPYP